MGGLHFFISIPCLIYLGIFNSIFFISILFIADWLRLFWWILGGIAGALLANLLIRYHLAVLIHELRHAVLSNFVGNKHVSMKIEKETGEYNYKYSEDSEKYNAMISLAPYFLPIFSMFGLIFVYLVYAQNQELALLLLGILYAVDLTSALKEVGDYQTDFTKLTGGFFVGLTYVIFMNITVISFIAIWVAGDWTQIFLLGAKHTEFLNTIFFWLKDLSGI